MKPFSEMINDNKTNVSQEATDENEQLPFDEAGQDKKECEAPVLSPDVSSKLMKLVNPETIEEPADESENEPAPPTGIRVFGACLCTFYTKNSFLVLLLLAILLAYAYPPLGATYLAPKVTATWIAVMIIFLLSGIKLKSEELSKSFQQLRFNLFVQVFNFFVVSSVVYGFSRLMLHLGALNRSLADGMVISASVPITVNMVLVLTTSANGDEAAAIFNAAFGNLTGVFLSPALILMYLGVSGNVALGNIFFKLGMRVVLPIAIGQIIHRYSPKIVDYIKTNKKQFSKVQEYCLIFIIYTVFCKTFSVERDTTAKDAFVMISFVLLLLTSMMILAWFGLKLCFPTQPKLRVMGLFGCTHKSVAMGVPLINAIYEDDPLVGFYTLPLLVWHPMQLVLGSFLAPRLSKFVKAEEERLNLNINEEEGQPSV